MNYSKFKFPKLGLKKKIKRPEKYGNKKPDEPCSYGFSHRSLLEKAVCNLIALEEKAGKIVHEAHEDSVYLTEARYRCIPDFRCRDVATGQVFWREAKGFANQRWPTTKKLWKFYGPGPLEVWKGDYRRPVLAETIIPRKKGKAS